MKVVACLAWSAVASFCVASAGGPTLAIAPPPGPEPRGVWQFYDDQAKRERVLDVLRFVYGHRLDLTPGRGPSRVPDEDTRVQEIERYQYDVGKLAQHDPAVMRAWTGALAQDRTIVTAFADDPVAYARHLEAVLDARTAGGARFGFEVDNFSVEGDVLVSHGLRLSRELEFPGRDEWRQRMESTRRWDRRYKQIIEQTNDLWAPYREPYVSELLGLVPPGDPSGRAGELAAPGHPHPRCEAAYQALLTALQSLRDHMARWPLEAMNPAWYAEWLALTNAAQRTNREYQGCIRRNPGPEDPPLPPIEIPESKPPKLDPRLRVPEVPVWPCAWRGLVWPSPTPSPPPFMDPDCGCVEQWWFNAQVCGSCSTGIADQDLCEQWAEDQLAWCLKACEDRYGVPDTGPPIPPVPGPGSGAPSQPE